MTDTSLTVPPGVAAWLNSDDASGLRSGQLALVASRLRRNRAALAAGAWLLLVIAAAVFAPLIVASPTAGVVADRLAPIFSSGHVLGTDDLGRDMLSRLVYGARISLIAGIVPVSVAFVAGGTIGVLAGYFGGVIDMVLMRIMDVSYAFPSMVLAIGFALALGSGLQSMLIALTIVAVPPISRVSHAACRRVESQEFVIVSRASGIPTRQILWRNIVPNALPQIVVYASSWIGGCMLTAASLSFLGLGVQPPTPDWGSMLSELADSISLQPGIVVLPGLMIFATVLAFNMITDALADAMEIER